MQTAICIVERSAQEGHPDPGLPVIFIYYMRRQSFVPHMLSLFPEEPLLNNGVMRLLSHSTGLH